MCSPAAAVVEALSSGFVVTPVGSVCAICGHGRRGDVQDFPLTHGVSVHLCGKHRHPSYLSRDGGSTFTRTLETLWHAHGAATRHRLAALRAHRRQHEPRSADLPGSYAWPELRQEAERRFARGDPPANVIHELRELHATAPARVPSARTMQRWFHEARWRPADAEAWSPTWRRLPRTQSGISEETVFGALTPLLYEDRERSLPETAGLGDRPRPGRRR